MRVAIFINKKDMAFLRDSMGYIQSKGVGAFGRSTKQMSKKLSKNMVNEINRQGMFWTGKLMKSVSHETKGLDSKKRIKYFWDIPIYAMYKNDLKHSYWAPTFVEGNTASGIFKENIKFLEDWRESKGIDKEELPFIRIKPNPWFDLAWKNLDGDLDKYIDSSTEIDEELRDLLKLW